MQIKKERFKASEFCKIVGISVRTLDRRIAAGLIKPIVINNHRYFEQSHIDEYLERLPQEEARINVAYSRVSSSKQKDELINQRDFLEKYMSSNGIKIDKSISDIGSGINFNRKGFLELIDLVIERKVNTIYITYKDRLCRFAFDLLEYLTAKFGTKIEVINVSSTSPQEELIEDLMTIIHVFSSRLYGLRKYKKGLKDALNKKNSD